MTKQEKKRLSSVVRATEYLFLETLLSSWCSNTVKSHTGRRCLTIFLLTKKCWPEYA